MRYQGGKYRQAGVISNYVNMVKTTSHYCEPFCGALSVACKVDDRFELLLCDNNKALITMWSYLLNNEVILPSISESDYNELKNLKDPDNWLTAYAGFGLSFGGKWFGGYARGRGDYNGELQRSVEKKIRSLKSKKAVDFVHCDCYDLVVNSKSVIYLDPPYVGRTGVGGFNRDGLDVFELGERLVNDGHIVLITEFRQGGEFIPLHNFGDTVVRHHKQKTKGDGTSELLMCHQSQMEVFK